MTAGSGTRTTRTTTSRVLLENGEYWLNNKGDQAILDVTVRRCAQRWPTARIGVLTSAPRLLQAYQPAAEPVRFGRGGAWRGRGPAALPGAAALLDRLGSARTGPLLNAWDAAVARAARARRAARTPGRARSPAPWTAPRACWPSAAAT